MVETVLFDDGTTPEVLADPNRHANGHPVPKTFVARAGGKGKRDTTLDEMRRWEDGRHASAIIRRPPMYFQQFHSIAPAKEALTCNECHTRQSGRMDYESLGYNPKEIEGLTEER